MSLDDTKLTNTKLLAPILKASAESHLTLDLNTKLLYTLLTMDLNRHFKKYKEAIEVTQNHCGKKDETKRRTEIIEFILTSVLE